jgi:hypothetical protein
MKEKGTDAISQTQYYNDVVDAVVVRQNEIRLVNKTASAVNMLEVFKVILFSNVKMGNWATALYGEVDLGTTGFVTGCVSAVNAEIHMPSTNPTGGAGTYWAYEAELGFPTGYTSTVPVAFFGLNAWGAAVAYFDDYGFLFDISGVTASTTHFFHTNTASAATHGLKCRVNGTSYAVLLGPVA